MANRHLPPIAAIVLVILIAVQAADLTWRLLESPAEQDVVPATMPIAGGSAGDRGALTTSLEVLSDWRPFGVPPAPEERLVTDADVNSEETELALTLNGADKFVQPPAPG